MSNKGKLIWMPLAIAVAVVAGIYIGYTVSVYRVGDMATILQRFYSSGDNSKLNELLSTIESQYVEPVDIDSLVEEAIPTIVGELDPHSVYIPAEDLEATNEELEGSFGGVGVQFSIQQDSVVVVSVVSGGPSEKLGIMPGDRIVTINDSVFTGKDITNERVLKTLRGPKGTDVKVGIKRATSKDILTFDITRGEIPVTSVDAAFTIDGTKYGYIKVSKFGRTTYSEFVSALAKLNQEGDQGYIIDLRGNSGGYMDMAINMINEFLPKDQLIVYTEGQTMPRNDAVANGKGSFLQTPIVVLIDEWSASASEIFAGAIQDNDRGTIVGRRSFGKGLVQSQFPLSDGSALRLTIARYYTPSGRCIQKQYEMGKGEDYSLDILNRYSHGEFYSQDSIRLNDTIKYTTRLGRTVYGGGGIMPDIFVPSDTAGVNSYLNSVVNKGLIYQFAFNYTDANRARLAQYTTYDALQKYLASQPLVEQLVAFAETKGIRRRPVLIAQSRNIMARQIESYIIRNMLDEDSFYRSFLRDDKTIQQAVEVLKKGESFPKAPSND